MLLRADGVEAHAVWRNVDILKQRERTSDGRFYARFRDSFRFEVAAYVINRELGLDRVPPAVLRRYRGEVGSLQIWVENVMTEKGRGDSGLAPPDTLSWLHQRYIRHLFDNLIHNVDRNQGNILIDRDSWKVWFIDHTRSFAESDELLKPEQILLCERRLWQRLRAVDFEQLRQKLEPSLLRPEIDFLFKRWVKIVERLEGRIESAGEDAVLFDLKIPSESAG